MWIKCKCGERIWIPFTEKELEVKSMELEEKGIYPHYRLGKEQKK